MERREGKGIARRGRAGFLLLLLSLLVLWNLRFYARPTVTADHGSAPPYAEAQLRWLRGALDDGGGDRMQRLFPEGWFFCHLLYGLSWVELALRDPGLTPEALREARWALEGIESDKGKAPFPPELPPHHGMFYSAWRNHLLSGILLIQPAGERDATEMALLEARCAELAETLRQSRTPFPPSYREQSWPCDTPPAIHSLAVRDAIVGDAAYAPVIRTWLDVAKTKLDPQTGLLPHMADLRAGDPATGARATSQTIILRFLADIDPAWARDQYRKFREQFFVRKVGIAGIREYPRGVHGYGDVDSGPLLAGISGSATVVGMGVAGIYGDHAWARSLSQTGEALGLPFGRKERRYLGGLVPVGDAFLVHATTARPWLRGNEVTVEPLAVSPFWRWGVHLLSLAVLGLLWGVSLLGSRMRRGRRERAASRG